MRSPPDDIFRKEALDAMRAPPKQGGVLRISPAWTRYGFWSLVALVVAALVYSVVGSIKEYAQGPAFVRAEGNLELTATVSGTVAAVHVEPGQRVTEGALLVEFHVVQEAAELERIDREIELQLVRVMRDLNDQAARQALTSLQAQRELARAHVDERSVRAPRAGVVSDIRIRAGQLLTQGQPILSIVAPESRFSVLALVPGQYRPLLQKGSALRLELSGFPYVYTNLTVDSIGQEVIGPTEAKRFLGPEVADALPISGPVVLVKAWLPAATFISEGQTFNYYNNVPGTAEVVVRERSVLLTLVPALRAVFGDDSG